MTDSPQTIWVGLSREEAEAVAGALDQGISSQHTPRTPETGARCLTCDARDKLTAALQSPPSEQPRCICPDDDTRLGNCPVHGRRSPKPDEQPRCGDWCMRCIKGDHPGTYNTACKCPCHRPAVAAEDARPDYHDAPPDCQPEQGQELVERLRRTLANLRSATLSDSDEKRLEEIAWLVEDKMPEHAAFLRTLAGGEGR